jgi:hypothetical protein
MSSIVEVSNLEEIKAAMQSKQHMLFKNPPQSIYYLGLGYLVALKNWLEENYAHLTFICDCASNAALAHQAMLLGFKYVLFEGEAEYEQKLQNIANSLGVKLITKASQILQ